MGSLCFLNVDVSYQPTLVPLVAEIRVDFADQDIDKRQNILHVRTPFSAKEGEGRVSRTRNLYNESRFLSVPVGSCLRKSR